MSDIVFMDTETLGLDPEAPIWEFAAVRRNSDGEERSEHLFIRHQPYPWLYSLPDQFADDYMARYKPKQALTKFDAAMRISRITSNAHIIGAVPNFDTERLTRLMEGIIEPEWHYHLIDVENVVVGYLHGVAARAIDEARMRGEEPLPGLLDRSLNPPWKSDELSRAVGVDPEQFARHTAMGDVLWVRAQWDAVTGSVA